MKKIITILLLSLGLNLFSQVVPEPSTTFYVTDLADILTDNEEVRIDALIREYKSKTTTEFSVLTIKSLEGNDLESYANTVFRKWGIGTKAHNNGLLILVSLNDRKLRIETGYGIEPYLTDAYTKEVSIKYATPYFKKGEYFTGIENLVTNFQSKLGYENFGEIIKRENKLKIEKNLLEEKEAALQKEKFYTFLFYTFIFLIIGSIIGVIVYFVNRYNKRKASVKNINTLLSKEKLTEAQIKCNTLFAYKANILQKSLPTLLSTILELTKVKLDKLKYDDLISHEKIVIKSIKELEKELFIVTLNKNEFETSSNSIAKLSIPNNLVISVDQLCKVEYDIQSDKAKASLNELNTFYDKIKTTELDSLATAKSLLTKYELLIAKVKSDISKCEVNKSKWSSVKSKFKTWPSLKTELNTKYSEFKSSYDKVLENWGELTKNRLSNFDKLSFSREVSAIDIIINSLSNNMRLSYIERIGTEYDTLLSGLKSKLNNPSIVDLELRRELSDTSSKITLIKSRIDDAVRLARNSDVNSSNRNKAINYVNSLSGVVALTGLAILVNKKMINDSEETLSSLIKKMKNDISEAEDQRRREEEARQRRKREEEAAAAALLASAYAASNYSSSSSSSSSYGSSYSGGSSGGSGSSSSWD